MVESYIWNQNGLYILSSNKCVSNRRNDRISFVILYCIVFTCFLGNDVHYPNILEMRRDLNCTEEQIRSLFPIALFICCIGQFILGALVDFMKRKSMLLMCAICILIGKFLSIFANNFLQIMISRIIEYSFVGGVWTVVTGIGSDIVDGDQKRMAKFLSGIEIIYPIALTLAPFIGKVIGDFFGWRGCFIFLFIASLLCFISAFLFIKETYEKTKKIDISDALNGYMKLIKNKSFWFCVIVMLLSSACVTSFNYISAYCCMDYFHRSKFFYTCINTMPTIICGIGSVIYILLIRHVDLERIIKSVMIGYLIFIIVAVMYNIGLVESSPVYFFLLGSICVFLYSFVHPSMDVKMMSFEKNVQFSRKFALSRVISISTTTPIVLCCSNFYSNATHKDYYSIYWLIGFALLIIFANLLYKKVKASDECLADKK